MSEPDSVQTWTFTTPVSDAVIPDWEARAFLHAYCGRPMDHYTVGFDDGIFKLEAVCTENPNTCACDDCGKWLAECAQSECDAEMAIERHLEMGDPRDAEEMDRELAIENMLHGTYRNDYYGG